MNEEIGSQETKTDDKKRFIIGFLLLFLLILAIVISVLILRSNKSVEKLSDDSAYRLFEEAYKQTNEYNGLIQAKGGIVGFEMLFEYDKVNSISHSRVSVNDDSYTETYDNSIKSYSTFDSGENWYISDSNASTILNGILGSNNESDVEDSYKYEGVVDCNSFGGECHKFVNNFGDSTIKSSVLISGESKLVDSLILDADQTILFEYSDAKIRIPDEIKDRAEEYENKLSDSSSESRVDKFLEELSVEE